MEKKTKRSYSREFKERAVKMSYERNTLKEFSLKLGITSEHPPLAPLN